MVGQIKEYKAENISAQVLIETLNIYYSRYLWVIADGSEYYAENHPVAAAVIGTYDNKGVEVFAVQDKSGVVGIGVGSNTDPFGNEVTIVGGSEYGVYRHKLLIPEIPPHYHEYYKQVEFVESNNWSGDGVIRGASGVVTAITSFTGGNSDGLFAGGDPHENMQPCVGMHYVVALDKI